MQMRAAIYTRVSLNEQDTGPQESELFEYVARRGWTATLYRDSGQSGAKESRPALDALLADARRRKLDVVVVWALDRLARSLRQLLFLADEFHALGVDLVAVKQSIDTSSAAGRLTYSVLGAVAEFEREMLRERVRAGIQQARRAGKRIGRPALRGFNTDERTEIQRLRRGGASVRSLALRYGTTQWMISQIAGELTSKKVNLS